ncbi:MAG: hypothetical protein N3F66_00765 [Spirochaetes bacterium]|nr:hypothetical protein [Spirochaetota bacterium]
MHFITKKYLISSDFVIIFIIMPFIVCYHLHCTPVLKDFRVYKLHGEIYIDSNKAQLHQTVNNNTIETNSSSYCVIGNDTTYIFITGNSAIDFDIDNTKKSINIQINRGNIILISDKIIKNITVTTPIYEYNGDIKNIQIMTKDDALLLWSLEAKGTLKNTKDNIVKFIDNKHQFIQADQDVVYLEMDTNIYDELRNNAEIFKKGLMHNNLEENFMHQKLIALGNKDIKETIMLALLEKREGKLKKVITKSGNEYIGIAVARGKMLEILTVKGKIVIPQSNVKYVLYYSPFLE